VASASRRRSPSLGLRITAPPGEAAAVSCWGGRRSEAGCRRSCVLIAASDDESTWLDKATTAGCGCSHEASSLSAKSNRCRGCFPTSRKNFTHKIRKIGCSSTKRRLRIRVPRIRCALAAMEELVVTSTRSPRWGDQCICHDVHCLWIPINSPAYSDPISPVAFFNEPPYIARSSRDVISRRLHF
jgi:hypothetical protein